MDLRLKTALTAFLAIATVVALIYANSLQNEFTFDDHPIVAENRVLDGSIEEILTSPFWPGKPELGLYRPLTLLSFATNKWLLGSGFCCPPG